jgi:hypothetical protein
LSLAETMQAEVVVMVLSLHALNGYMKTKWRTTFVTYVKKNVVTSEILM